ncbi:MAG: flippase [candidate division FCPU426 bacterium]
MSFTRAFAKNAFFKGAGEVLIRLLSFAFMVLVARTLGESDFGALNFAYSFPLLFVVIVDFGLNPLLVRDAARDPERTGVLFRHLLALKLILGAVFLAAVALGLHLIAPSPLMRRCAYWLAAFVLLHSFTEFFNAVFNARQQLQWEALVFTLQKVALLVFGLLALGWGMGVLGVAAAYAAAGVLGLAAAAWLLGRSRMLGPAGSWSADIFRYALRQALPLTLTTLFVNLYFRIDMTLLAKLRPAAEVGWYGAAHKCIEVLMVVPAVLVVAAFPGFSQLFRTDREQLARVSRQLLRLLVFLGLPVAVGAVMLGEPLMVWLFGKPFAPAGTALAWLAVALSFIFVNYALSFLLISGEHQRVNALASGMAVVVSVAANLALIPRFGHAGSAAAAATTELMLLCAYAWAVRRYLFPLQLGSAVARTAAAAACMAPAVWWLRALPLLVPVAAGAAVFTAAAWIFGAVKREDWQLLKRALPGGRG